MACNSFYAKADNATISWILSWQLNSNLVYFLLCCNSPVTHWCLSFSLRIAWQKSGLLLRPGHTEGTKAYGQFRWITDYFTVISVHCLKQD